MMPLFIHKVAVAVVAVAVVAVVITIFVFCVIIDMKNHANYFQILFLQPDHFRKLHLLFQINTYLDVNKSRLF